MTHQIAFKRWTGVSHRVSATKGSSGFFLAANMKPLWVYFTAKLLQMWYTGSELKKTFLMETDTKTNHYFSYFFKPVFSKVNSCKGLLTFTNRPFVTLSFFKRPLFSCVSLPLQVLPSLASHSSHFLNGLTHPPEALSVSSAGSLSSFEPLGPLCHLIYFCCPLLSSSVCHLNTNLQHR